MGDFDFGGNNFSEIEKAKEIKTRYDALIAKMFTSGYSEELYKEYIEIKAQVAALNSQIVTEAGINMAILDMVEQKHQEYVQKMAAVNEEIAQLNNKYIVLLENFILNHDPKSNDDVQEYKTLVGKASNEAKKYVHDNADVYKAIANAFVKKEEPKPAKTGLEIEDLSLGLDLKDEKQVNEYKERLIIPFARQLTDKILKLVKDQEKTFDKKGYIRIIDKKVSELLYAETKAPAQVVNNQVKDEDIMRSLSYDKLNGTLVFTPKVFTIINNVTMDDSKSGIGKVYVHVNYDTTVLLGTITEQIFEAVNQALARKGLCINYDVRVDIKEWIKSKGRTCTIIEDDELVCDPIYERDYFSLGEHKKYEIYESQLKRDYEGTYEIPYFFEISELG